MNTDNHDGSSWANQAHRDLMRMGADDAHAIFLLDALFDYAQTELPVDLPLLRAHCAEPTRQVDDKSMDFNLTCLPDYLRSWLWESDEATAQSWWREILAALHSLRTGRRPCARCLEIGWHVGLINSREPFYIDCAEHHITPREIVTPKPLLKVVA
jgi:hypothetical protein